MVSMHCKYLLVQLNDGFVVLSGRLNGHPTRISTLFMKENIISLGLSSLVIFIEDGNSLAFYILLLLIGFLTLNCLMNYCLIEPMLIFYLI